MPGYGHNDLFLNYPDSLKQLNFSGGQRVWECQDVKALMVLTESKETTLAVV